MRLRDHLMSLMEEEDATCHRLAEDQGRHRGLGLDVLIYHHPNVATFVIQRILSDTGGLNFMCITAERFVVTFSCHKILGLPNALLDGTFSTFLFDDHTTRGWLHQLLINLQGRRYYHINGD
ncbi:hypothetical protein Tco_0496615 [Tanacetum coccineum]